MSKITNPHDRFVRESFAHLELAADFLAHYLPPAVAERVDLSTLRLEPESFVDPDLRLHQSDLLYRTAFQGGGEASIYLLLEHKSYVDRLVSLQLLGYLVRIWERDARVPDAGPRPLRPVVPIVLYHGELPWSGPTHIGALIEGPADLEQHWPDLQFTLVDLSDGAGAAIAGGVVLRTILMLLQAIRSRDFGGRLPGILALLGELADQRSALRWFDRVLRYVSHTSATVTEREFVQAARAALPVPGGDKVTTLVEQWLARGRKEGRREGQQEGWREGRREGLREGLELALEARFGETGLALLPEIRKITDENTLQAILRAIWQVESEAELRRVYQ